jgi:hypothetical protein
VVRVVSSSAPRGGGEGVRVEWTPWMVEGREPGGQDPVATDARFGGSRNGTEEGMADRNFLEAVGFAGGQSVSPGCCAGQRPPVRREGDASCPDRTGPDRRQPVAFLVWQFRKPSPWDTDALDHGPCVMASQGLRLGGPFVSTASGSRWIAPFCFTDSPFEKGRRPGAGAAARC